MRPEGAEIPETEDGVDVAPAGVGNGGLEGDMVAVDAAESGDSLEALRLHRHLPRSHCGACSVYCCRLVRVVMRERHLCTVWRKLNSGDVKI